MRQLFGFSLPALLISAVLSSCVNTSSPKESSDLTDPETLAALVNGNLGDYLLIDVRTPGEYASGHIPSAINIPYDTIAEKLPTDDKNARIVVYCRSGSRSAAADKTLKSLGYTDVTDFGGVGNWKGSLETGE